MNVLVLDEAFISGAVAAIGLRGAGCRVHVIAAAGGRGACRGRESIWELAPRVDDPRLIQVIDDRARESTFDVVYPVTEPMQRLAWDTGMPWRSAVFPAVDAKRAVSFGSKRRMSEAVAAAGVAVPREHDAFSDADVDAGVRALGLPVVVKGTVGRGGSATVIAGSAGDARSAAARLRRVVPEVFLQQFIAGHTYLAGGVFERGRAVRFYAAQKTTQFPAATGPAAELLSVNDDALAAAALRAFEAAEITGIASADFIRERAGRYQFLELNPRPWGSMAAAAAAGVDLYGPLVDMWRKVPIAPSLDFNAGVRTPTLPLYVLSGNMWISGRALSSLRSDLPRVARFAWREPRLSAHLAHRCARVLLNW